MIDSDPRQTHAAEQQAGAMRELARAVRAFNLALRAEGFDHDEAIRLTEVYLSDSLRAGRAYRDRAGQ